MQFAAAVHQQGGARGDASPHGGFASRARWAGAAGFGFTTGEIWAVHVGWSGNQLAYAERTYNGIGLLGGGELLLPGEVRLAPGESYRMPWVYASYGSG